MMLIAIILVFIAGLVTGAFTMWRFQGLALREEREDHNWTRRALEDARGTVKSLTDKLWQVTWHPELAVRWRDKARRLEAKGRGNASPPKKAS